LLVPSIVLKQDFKGTFLFIAKKDGENTLVRKVYVKTGKTVQDVTKVEKGLKIDDQVIVKGYNLVSDGEAVSIMN
nr:hypothetical protein [Bacteroidales bacterium]